MLVTGIKILKCETITSINMESFFITELIRYTTFRRLSAPTAFSNRRVLRMWTASQTDNGRTYHNTKSSIRGCLAFCP
jgi:hypothetical protein